MPSNGKIAVLNKELAALQLALRECGGTKVPMRVALGIVEVQRQIQGRMDDVSALNKGLVEEHGIPAEGEDVATQVSSEMPGWTPYVAAFNELMGAEIYFDEPFILYEREDSYGWTPDGNSAIELTANTIFDMGGLLKVQTKKQK
jgi:hypothetical protein|tara:strand:- start:3156 stop:3590 length:435 start_codon:yes stop_codon:yes gene_type:complete